MREKWLNDRLVVGWDGLLIQPALHRPLELGLVDVAVLIADRGEVGLVLLGCGVKLNERNHVGTQFLQGSLHGVHEQLACTLLEEAGLVEDGAVVEQLLEREDARKEQQDGLGVLILEFVALNTLSEELEGEVEHMSANHVDQVLSEMFVHDDLLLFSALTDLAHNIAYLEGSSHSESLIEVLNAVELIHSGGHRLDLHQLAHVVEVREDALGRCAERNLAQFLLQVVDVLLGQHRVVTLISGHRRVVSEDLG